MPVTATNGFQSTGAGIFFWFLDSDGIANRVGPVSLLENLGKNEFWLFTNKGHRYRVFLHPDQVAEFQRLGGCVQSQSKSDPVACLKIRWGFHKNEFGIFLWYHGKDTVKRLGPVLELEHLEEDRFSLVTKQASHPIRLSSQNLEEFERLGGKVVAKNINPSTSRPQAPVNSPDHILRENVLTIPSLASNNVLRGNDRQTLRWRGIGQKVRIGPYTIVDPLAYFSEGMLIEDEASCIDVTLPVGQPIEEPQGALGYWPQYGRISQDQRANYLAWLASGRNADLGDIGYAFMYFYGLERRVLVDNQDINAVTREAVRLLTRYTFSGAFTGYLSRLLAYIIARTGLEKLREEWFNEIFEVIPLQSDEEILALALAWHVKRGQPLSVTWAMRMAKQHPRAQRSVVVERASEQFSSLFAKKYKDCLGDGLYLKSARRERAIRYSQPASPSLLDLRRRNPVFADSVPIPDVLGLQSQFLPLVSIWAECIEDLKPLSRQLARGIEVNMRSAYEVLPEDLKAETEHPDKPRWDAVVAQLTREDGFVAVPVSQLAVLQGIDPRRRLTIKQSESLARTAEEVGFCVEPDTRITGRAYEWDDCLALFRPDDRAKLPTDNRYAIAALILELGLAVASADGVITDAEMVSVSRFLESQFLLDLQEVRRLKQLERVFLRRHPSLSRVSKRLFKVLSSAQREMLSRFLFGVAAANDEINDPTLKALRSAYRALGVDISKLDSLLEKLHATRQGERTPASSAGSADQGHLTAADTALNQDLIRQIMADTQAVAVLLTSAMQQGYEDTDDWESSSQASVAPLPLSPDARQQFPGLSDRFQPLLAELLSRDQWPAADYESLVRARGLMPADAISRINEWAEERLGNPLIEEGQSLIIHGELIRDRQ